jgi:hypothetical protein
MTSISISLHLKMMGRTITNIHCHTGAQERIQMWVCPMSCRGGGGGQASRLVILKKWVCHDIRDIYGCCAHAVIHQMCLALFRSSSP